MPHRPTHFESAFAAIIAKLSVVWLNQICFCGGCGFTGCVKDCGGV